MCVWGGTIILTRWLQQNDPWAGPQTVTWKAGVLPGKVSGALRLPMVPGHTLEKMYARTIVFYSV